jgi:cellulose synthase/poly-beta-1,6-N-acetylglucosamine synthase-like glycosyltransferase
VIITTCNEPLDVVQDTIRAALSLDYLSHRYRVIVSDDGEDERLRSWVHGLARPNASLKDGADIFYTSRCKTSRVDFKAGNLNHAVMLSEASGGAEFIAGLDVV